MTLDPGPIAGAGQARELDAGAPDADAPSDAEPLRILSGRLVSLRFLLDALRRTRRVWLALAVAGLLAGVGYHVVVPPAYSATATLYLAHPSGTSPTAQAQDDLAMLDTQTVGRRAIALLGRSGRGLTPADLLGKTPGTMPGTNVMVLAISGPTASTAARRVDAVARAYLSFRAQLFESQHRALVTATDGQLTRLQAEVTSLDAETAALGARPAPEELASLQAQRAADTLQIIGLQQAVQQDSVNTLSVVNGSRVITPGTVVPVSRKRTFALDGLTGLLAGLGLGMGAVVVLAVLSDRVRRREDVSALLGAPVGVSVGRIGGRRSLRGALRPGSADRPPLRVVVHYLEEELAAGGPHATELVVAFDDVRVPAMSLAAVAAGIAATGRRAVLVDETHTRALAKALGGGRARLRTVDLGKGRPVTLVVPPAPWEPDDGQDWLDVLGDVRGADAVLVLATVDPAMGAWHLRRWASEAIATVTTGAASTQQIATRAELLEAAGVRVSSAVLLRADATDESVGIATAVREPEASPYAPMRAATAPST